MDIYISFSQQQGSSGGLGYLGFPTTRQCWGPTLCRVPNNKAVLGAYSMSGSQQQGSAGGLVYLVFPTTRQCWGPRLSRVPNNKGCWGPSIPNSPEQRGGPEDLCNLYLGYPQTTRTGAGDLVLCHCGHGLPRIPMNKGVLACMGTYI